MSLALAMLGKAKQPASRALSVLTRKGPASEELWTHLPAATHSPWSRQPVWSWFHAGSATAFVFAAAAAEASALWPREGSSSSLTGNDSSSSLGSTRQECDGSNSRAKSSFDAADEACQDLPVGGFSFASSKVVDGSKLNAYGCCYLKYWGFEVCAAVLYMPESTTRPLSGNDVMDPGVPKQLELCYLRGFPAERLRFITRWAISQNGLLKGPVEDGLMEFNPLYRDVVRGDCYTLAYSPSAAGRGRVTLQLNGVELGGVEGTQFSEAIFSVWFGEKPFLAEMKKDLLRGQRPATL